MILDPVERDAQMVADHQDRFAEIGVHALEERIGLVQRLLRRLAEADMVRA